MIQLTSLLLKKNKINFDKEELTFQIQSHPSYPSLHSITGVLDHFNIQNIAARIPNTEDILSDIPNSFIAQLNQENRPDLFFVEKNNEGFNYYDEKGKQKSLSTEDFFEQFTGIILAVEKDEDASKVQSKSKVNSGLYIFLICLCLGSIFIYSTWSVMPIAMFLISAVGIFISSAILQQELGIRNSIGEAFCTSQSDKKDCHAVLSSKGAQLFGIKKLSDLCIIYFVGYTLAVFLLSIQGQSLQPVYAVSLLALPVTLYSIYYQGIVLKTWCLLCLSIVGLLWLLAGLPFLLGSFSFDITYIPVEILIVISAFVISYAGWSYIKPKYEASIENKQYKIDYFKFKKDYTVFSSILKSEPAIDTIIGDIPEIIFGNSNSKVEIVVVTNPFCGHCKPVHNIIEGILKKYSEQVKIIIRFNINISNKTNDAFKIVSNLMHLYNNDKIEDCKLAMHDAYGGLVPKDWMLKWENYTINTNKILDILKQQKDWCADNNLNFTPAILINGYQFPRVYERKDLMFFIEELGEEYNQQD